MIEATVVEILSDGTLVIDKGFASGVTHESYVTFYERGKMIYSIDGQELEPIKLVIAEYQIKQIQEKISLVGINKLFEEYYFCISTTSGLDLTVNSEYKGFPERIIVGEKVLIRNQVH